MVAFIACPECGNTSIYRWDVCPNCSWSPKIKFDAEVKMSYAYEICPDCGGIKWVQVPETDYDDSTTGVVSLKGCNCPPKPKSELLMTIACPHCGKFVTFEVRGDIRFDLGERKEI